MTKIIVVAHNISAPLYKHRSKEFSERMYFMAKHNDEVHIISKEAGFFQVPPPVHDEISPNIIIHRVPRDAITSNIQIFKIAMAINAEVIFADGMGHGLSCLLSRRYKIPVVTFIQGHEADLKSISIKLRLGLKPLPGLLSKIFEVSDTIILRNSDRILSVSDCLVEYAREKLGKKSDSVDITLIPHSLQYINQASEEAKDWANNLITTIQAKQGKDVSLIMVVGVDAAKGTDIALKTQQQILACGSNAVMIVAGKTINPKYVELARKLKIDSNLVFLEKLPREKVTSVLSHCSIFLLPSFSEGFSFAITEAMALGVPVVCFNNKSVKTALKANALVAIDRLNPKLFADQCIRLFNDLPYRKILVTNSKKYVLPYVNFSENDRYQLIRSVITDMLEKEFKQGFNG
jgi:glycosyltransferase involved in cell wall biosynthesis